MLMLLGREGSSEMCDACDVPQGKDTVGSLQGDCNPGLLTTILAALHFCMRIVHQFQSGLELTSRMMILLGTFRLSGGCSVACCCSLVPMCAAAAVCCCVFPLWAESNVLQKICLYPNKLFPLITQMNLIFLLLQMLSSSLLACFQVPAS